MLTTYIFFDVEGTLLYKKDVFLHIREVLKTFDYDIPVDSIRKHHNILTGAIVYPDKTDKTFYTYFNSQLLLSFGIIPEPILIDSIYDACRSLSWNVFDDVQFIKNIDVHKGIISNWDATLHSVLKKHIPEHFDLIIVSSEVHFQKPDANIFLYAKKQVKESFSSIVYVGDSIQLDIAPARALGMQTVLIDRFDRYHWYKGQKIRSLEELKDILL